MPRIPHDNHLDSTLALIRDPYRFISERCRHYGSDLFECRIMLRKTICMTGPEAAELFYDTSRFVRSGAMPRRIQKTLLGQGGVQGLDDAAHRHRKGMFMSVMTPERIAQLGTALAAELRSATERWGSMQEIVLYDALHEVLTRAVCAWAGVPLTPLEIGARTRDLTAMFDAAGSVGPRHWRSRLARRRAERWIERIIPRIRSGELKIAEDMAAHIVVFHRDLDGRLLSPRVAAVELLNLLRPTVAIAVYITFIAHALHHFPECRRKLESDDGYSALFVQEVRRFYPFFPAIAARVRRDFEWNGYHFPKGRRVILDLYSTDHDARTWNAPEEFRPERFRDWGESPFDFIPQGGGDHYRHHRCAGEWVTIALMKAALSILVEDLDYEVPQQDLRIDYTRLPALPRSRFVIRNVRQRRRVNHQPALRR